jgi:hypothetical protein
MHWLHRGAIAVHRSRLHFRRPQISRSHPVPGIHPDQRMWVPTAQINVQVGYVRSLRFDGVIPLAPQVLHPRRSQSTSTRNSSPLVISTGVSPRPVHGPSAGRLHAQDAFLVGHRLSGSVSVFVEGRLAKVNITVLATSSRVLIVLVNLRQEIVPVTSAQC